MTALAFEILSSLMCLCAAIWLLALDMVRSSDEHACAIDLPVSGEDQFAIGRTMTVPLPQRHGRKHVDTVAT